MVVWLCVTVLKLGCVKMVGFLFNLAERRRWQSMIIEICLKEETHKEGLSEFAWKSESRIINRNLLEKGHSQSRIIGICLKEGILKVGITGICLKEGIYKVGLQESVWKMEVTK